MTLFALGLNHHTAPLAVRERVVFHVERLRDALAEIKRGLAAEAGCDSGRQRPWSSQGRVSVAPSGASP